METFSASLAICVGNSPVPGEIPTQRPATRSFDVFFICIWINVWENNCKAGDLRRYRTNYGVIVMPQINSVYNGLTANITNSIGRRYAVEINFMGGVFGDSLC